MATLARAPEALSATRSPLALWHLLSLDAPTVAALWTWFIATVAHVPLPLRAPASVFLAVWLLYAADRLLDVRNLHASLPDTPPDASRHPNKIMDSPLCGETSVPASPDLEARHRFHARHRTGFLVVIAFVSAALAALLPAIPAPALRLDLALGAVLTAYFILIHATPAAPRLPKELAVGVFFAAAVFIPAIARAPALRLALLPSAVLLAALCSLNCLCIYSWEHPEHAACTPSPSPEPRRRSSSSVLPIRHALPHAATRVALRHLPILHLVLIAAATLLVLLTRQSIALAIALAATALLLLDRLQHRLTRLHLRAAADLALLTPLLVAPFLDLHR